MSEQIKLKIISIEGILVEENVDFIRAMSTSGDLGIYPNHTPLVSLIQEGVFQYDVGSETKSLFISHSTIIVSKSDVKLLVDYIQTVDDFNQSYLTERLDQLKRSISEEKDYTQLQNLLADKQRVESQLALF